MRVRGALSYGDAAGGVFEHGADDGNRRAVGGWDRIVRGRRRRRGGGDAHGLHGRCGRKRRKKGMPHAEDVEDAETRRARRDVGDEGGRGGRGGREGEEECLTTNYTKGGGRGPEKLPTDHAKGRERRKRESEVLPTEHTEYTEKSKRGIGRVAGTRDGRRRTITRARNDFLGARGRAAGAEMAGREPLSRGAGDGGK